VKEQLSALVDNELSEFEERRILQELDRDPQLRGAWQRYHLIRAAIANELDHVPSHASTDRIAAMLAAEPVVTARRSAGQLPRMAGGLAIAATVAGIAIFGLQTLSPPATTRPAPTSPASMVSDKPAAPLVAGTTRAVDPSAAIQTVRSSNTRWDTPEPEDEQMLDVYLVQHSEFASAGMRGMLPSYARVVGYSSNQ
jgi:sigma-E factor negative regulatory protein RseA